MQQRLIVLAGFLVSALPILAQGKLSLSLIDATHVTVADTTTAGTVDLYNVTGSTCTVSVVTASKVALVSGASQTLPGPLTLELKDALTGGTSYCAVDKPTGSGAKALTSAVYTYIPNVVKPVFSKLPADGSTVGAVHATASDTSSAAAWKVNIQLMQLVDVGGDCVPSNMVPVTLAGGTAVTKQQTDGSGNALFTTASAQLDGTMLCAIQSFSPLSGTTELYVGDAKTVLTSEKEPVVSATDWGLVRAYFTGGIALANDSSNFSAAYEFLSLDVDKTWWLPGNYLIPAKPAKGNTAATTTITLRPGEAFTINGRQKVVAGSTFVTGSLSSVSPTDATKGLTISGTGLRVQQTVPPPASTPIVVRGDVTVTASGNPPSFGEVTFAETPPNPADAVRISDGILHLPDAETIRIVGPATLTFRSDSPLPEPRRSHFHRFGINSYFETRLTAIPVSSNGVNTAPPVTGTTSSPSTTSFLSTQKTARVAVGVYAPFLLTRWKWNSLPNALFIAPLGKIGFDTLTSGTQQSVVVPGGGTTTETYQQVYNFRSYGARIGHMKLTNSANVAPEIYSYLDIGIGPYSNLESLVCGRTEYVTGGAALPGQLTATAIPNSQCLSSFPASYVDPNKANSYEVDETRTRVPRLDLEGLLKIPSTPIYIGFNANIAQKIVGRQNLDPAFKAPDDVRFFFGTKFDIATLVTKLGAKIGN